MTLLAACKIEPVGFPPLHEDFHIFDKNEDKKGMRYYMTAGVLRHR